MSSLNFILRRVVLAICGGVLLTALLHLYRMQAPGHAEALLTPAYKLTIDLDLNYISRPTWYLEVLAVYAGICAFWLLMLIIAAEATRSAWRWIHSRLRHH